MYANAAAPSRDSYTPKGPKPVFIQVRDFPPSDKMVTGEELYCALSRCVAFENIAGIQKIGALWRIYLGRHEDRVKLITQGLQIRSSVIPVYDTNPFTKVHNEELTRVTIKDIPLSVGDDLIKTSLEKMKCELKGEILRQKLRVNGRLVNCLNGDRVCYINPPAQPLPRLFHVANIFRGRIFHAGQPEQVKNCSKCLETGHHASQCTGEIKCKLCKKFGHKSVNCPSNANNGLRNDTSNESTSVPQTGRNATPARATDKPGEGHNGERHQPDTTKPPAQTSSASTSTHQRDDVKARTKTPRQHDISYFLRAKTGDSERECTGSGDHTTQESDDTLSSDESYTDEVHTAAKPRSPTPKKKHKKKSGTKKTSTRK